MAQGQSQASALEEVWRPVGQMNTNVRKRQSNRDHRCSKCNYKHAGRPCPAKGKQCRKCRKLNHFASCCKTKIYVKELTQQQSQYSVNNNDRELFYMAEITDGAYGFQAVPDSTAPRWVTLNVCSSRVKFKIDPGADVTVISMDEYKCLTDKPQLQPSTAQLTGVSAPIITPESYEKFWKENFLLSGIHNLV